MKETFAVVGLQFGDEGKGLVTAHTCAYNDNPVVVRFSGGQQAGHTVYHNDKSHVFSNFGAGTFLKAKTYWAKSCTFDPIGCVNEYKSLLDMGFLGEGVILCIDTDCQVTTPYDVLYNRSFVDNIMHGTCGVGVGATFKRADNYYSLTVSELINPTVLSLKMSMIGKYYHDISIADDYMVVFMESVKYLRELIFNGIVKIGTLDDIYIPAVNTLVYEGSQGLLLDKDIGFFPHVTRSNTGAKTLPKDNLHVLYVTRAYQTRHGNGPMTNNDKPHNILDNPHETNVTNEWQGEFRRSILDLDLLEYGLSKDSVGVKSKSLVITCLDHIVNEYRFTYR